MPVRGWLHQASKRLLSRSGKNQVSRQRNGTVKPSGLRLHATPCTHPGPANCITSCSDAKKKLSWLTFSSSGEFWVFDTDLRPGICQIRTASNSHFTPDSQIPRHGSRYLGPNLKPNFFDLGFSFTTEPTDRYRDRQKDNFFCGRRTDIFFSKKRPFFSRKDLFFGQEKTIFLRQDRIEIGRCSVRCFRPNHGVASSVR